MLNWIPNKGLSCMAMLSWREFQDCLDIGLQMMHRKSGKYTWITSTVHNNVEYKYTVFFCLGFRWFKFTLKPLYTIAHGNLLSAIWETSHWTSFVKFGLKTAWDISYDILWLFLKYVYFWLLQGHLSTLGKIIGVQKINFFSMKEWQGFNKAWGF